LGSDADNFAHKLKRALEIRGATQAALARLADVDQSSISRYLRGQCEPNLRQFCSIADALGVKPAALLPGATTDSVVATQVERDGCFYLFRAGKFLGEWHGPDLHLFENAVLIKERDGRKLLESAGIRLNGRKRTKKS
jgi:transcriptional regulator with XRE-family HTH domain